MQKTFESTRYAIPNLSGRGGLLSAARASKRVLLSSITASELLPRRSRLTRCSVSDFGNPSPDLLSCELICFLLNCLSDASSCRAARAPHGCVMELNQREEKNRQVSCMIAIAISIAIAALLLTQGLCCESVRVCADGTLLFSADCLVGESVVW